jgi:hypothetical protein
MLVGCEFRYSRIAIFIRFIAGFFYFSLFLCLALKLTRAAKTVTAEDSGVSLCWRIA